MRAIHAKKSRASGVTLMELLAVMLIAGLLAAVGVPAFNAILKGTALRNAATGLTDTLSMARQLAIANRYLYRVEFITDDPPLTAAQRSAGVRENSYRIYFVDRDAKTPSNPMESEKITIGKWKLLPRFVVFDTDEEPPPDEIVFYATGGAGSPFPTSFLITQEGKGNVKLMTIKVDGVTGRVKSDIGDTTSTH